ncbi:KRFJ protein, partial [Turnix velox]|nr:KRFJ protein [Turnix velox]
EVTWMEPCVYSRNLGSCVTSCGDSRVVVFAPPVFLTFPSPIISSCPTESIMGTSFPQPSGGGSMPLAFGSSSGMGGSYGSGGSFGSGGMSGMRGSYGSGGSFG